MNFSSKILLIISVLILTVILAWYWFEGDTSQPHKATATQGKYQLITGKTPADFFDTFQHEETKLEPKDMPKEPKSKVVLKWLNPENFFRKPASKTSANPELDIAEAKRNAILHETLFQQDYLAEVVDFTKNSFDEDSLYLNKNLSRDKDFSAQGIAKQTASYPVNLERVLTMNKHIPAVLYTEIHSEIPSQKVIAVIEQNVTGYHGRKILIPRGSQAIGRFGNLKSPDSERLGIVWYRILTPEGINIKLTSEAVDQVGSSGIAGIVDNRWKDKYGTALLFSSISALAQLSVPVDNENAKAAADSFSAELGPIVAEHLRQSLDIVPRINIPKGTRLNISPLQDIWFKEPVSSQINASSLPFELLKIEGK